MMKGVFITFEGIEGCGKSTQAKLLAERLQKEGKEVLLTREPGGPQISEAIRNLILNPKFAEMTSETEALLYMASRAQHTKEWIIPALEEGKTVICDRYLDSSRAYQGAARKIDAEVIDYLNEFSTCGIKPDLTFLIDIEVETSAQRISSKKKDRIEQESTEFHNLVRNGFLEISQKDPQRFFVIDGLKSIDETARIILEEIQARAFGNRE